MKKLQALLGAATACALFLTTGCSGLKKTITPQIVRQGVGAVVAYEVSEHPAAIPGVRLGGEVICSAATGNDISPSNVVAQIQALGTNFLSRESILIINGSLLLYTGVWNSYGDEAVNNRPVLKEYLQATCDGISDGLPGNALRAVPVSVQSWPLVKLPAK